MDREILYSLLIGSVFLFFTVTFGLVFLSTELVTVTVLIIVAAVGGIVVIFARTKQSWTF
jgi:hypothetical protein